MPAEVAVRAAGGVARSPGTVIGRLVAGKAARSGIIWGYIFGIAIASSAFSYAKVYKTSAERAALAAAYGSNRAVTALFGPAPRLETVGGFTAFKISMTLIGLGAVWGLLTSTRLLRGEEDSGRWEVLLAGATTRRRAAGQALGGLGAGLITLWAVTAVITVAVGQDSSVGIAAGPALYFALAMVATAAMFLAVGALTSQLAATRRQAAAYAAAFGGVGYAIRMLADAGIGLHGLIWVSPLGWVEELRPLTGSQPLALLPIAGFTAVLGAAAVYLAGRRDVGASLLPDRARGRAHTRLLSGPAGLAIRMTRAAVIGWWVAIAVSAALFGLIAKSAGGTISGSSVQQVLAKLGASGSGTGAVLGVCFLLLAVLIAFAGLGQLTAARSEEADGRLDHLLVRPVSRWSWFGGRLVVAVVVVLAGGLIAGFCGWLSAASQHAGLSLPTMLAAGVNLVPPALAILGVGALAFGIRPRVTGLVGYVVLGWSLLVVVIGGIGATSGWVLDTSVFHQMASAPAVPPHWTANAIMTGIFIAAASGGGVAFRRRDVQGS